MQATGAFLQLGHLAADLGQFNERLTALETSLPAQEGTAACALLACLASASRHLDAARHALLGTAPTNTMPSASAIPGLGRALASGLQSSTRTVPLQDLFSFLATTRRAGILRVETSTERFVVHFAHGEVSYAFGDGVPPGEALGDILCAQGVLTNDQLELLPERTAQDAWLTPAMIASGWIARRDLQAALAQQTRTAFLRLCRVSDARYTFAEGSPSQALTTTRFHPIELLLESTRLSDESRWRGVEPDERALPFQLPFQLPGQLPGASDPRQG